MMADLDSIILQNAKQRNLDPRLIRAVVDQESTGNPSAKNLSGGGQGAYGAMQVRAPALADYNAANGTQYTMKDLLKPEIGVGVGSWYLGQQLDKFNDPVKALVAYNEGAGSPNVSKGPTPYVNSVMSRLGGQQGQQKNTVLPGIPVAQSANGQSDDAIFSAFSGGGASAASAQGPQSDDAIFAAFNKQPQAAQSQNSVAPAPQVQQASGQPGAVASFGAGAGRGVQQTALGTQQLVGHGLQALGDPGNRDNQMGPTGKPLTPIGKTIVDTLSGLASKAGNWLVGDANSGLAQGANDVAPYQAAHPIATTAGNISGSVAATAPLAALAPVARTYKGAMAVGAGLGAANASLAPVEGGNPSDYWAEKSKQIALGGLTGGAVSPALMGLGRMISPQVSSDVQTLMDKGITPTPGQILGGGWARTESKLTSVPVLGDMIKNAQQRAVNQFNEAAYNEALAPIGQKFSGKVGQEGIEQVGNKIGAVYDDILPKMKLQVDPQFQTDVTNLGQMAQGLPEAQQKTFMNILKNQIFGKIGPQGQMDGIDLKGVQSELARTAKGYLSDSSYDNRQLGAAVSALRDAVDSNLARVNPADLSQKLTNANQAWANFVRLRTAAASQGAMNNEGIFTAAQLQNAVRGADKSVGKGATATGNALMQDLSGAGQRVLGSKYPDSGTAGRGLMALLAPSGLAAGFATQPGATAATLGGIGLGSLPYTSLGQKLTAQALTARPGFAAPLGNFVTGLGPKVVAGSLPALISGGK